MYKVSPFEVVLLNFVYFQKDPSEEVKIDAQSLIKTMITANCPSETIAEEVLAQMVKAGLLVEQTEDLNVFYARTQLGIAKTPSVSKGSVKH